jgi:hypothetical protein
VSSWTLGKKRKREREWINSITVQGDKKQDVTVVLAIRKEGRT